MVNGNGHSSIDLLQGEVPGGHRGSYWPLAYLLIRGGLGALGALSPSASLTKVCPLHSPTPCLRVARFSGPIDPALRHTITLKQPLPPFSKDLALYSFLVPYIFEQAAACSSAPLHARRAEPCFVQPLVPFRLSPLPRRRRFLAHSLDNLSFHQLV